MTEPNDRRRLDDVEYLRRVQYGDDAKLGARIALHARFSTNPQGWHAWHYDQIAPYARARVLEVGCGPGTLWTRNGARLPSGLQLVLTDFSEGMLAAAQHELEQAGIDAAFGLEDVQELSFPDASFDIVIAAHMLYHVPDRDQAIRELRRVLRPDGRAVVATNGHGHLAELDTLLERHVKEPSRDDVTFTLENGEAQLRAAFSSVERRDHADGLLVTEGPPLVQYLLSMHGGEDLGAAEIDVMSREAEALTARGAGFAVAKSAGAFLCR